MAASGGQIEGLFGQIAVARHLATAADVQSCLDLQAQEAAAAKPRRALGEIMTERGIITAAQAGLILEEQRRRQGPKRLGPYEILSKIGEGGMSAVYRARVATTGVEVALKILPRKYSDDATFLTRFMREAKLGMELEHPNIVRTVDYGQVSGIHYMALEYVDGGSLDKLLKARNILTEDESLAITLEVAKALQYAADRDLVHRDVKPSNIMLTSNGLVKLSDFGLVKHTDPEASKLTQSGLMVGTPHYISPEQARGDKGIDIRADLYSLGATLYHLVTGQTPFSGSSALVIITKHLKEDLTPPDEINPALSDGCVAIIEKMMAKDRDDRYALPQQVIEDIAHVLNGGEPLNAAIEIGKSSVRVSAKRLQKVQQRTVGQPGRRRTGDVPALHGPAPARGRYVVPGAELPRPRQPRTSGVVDAVPTPRRPTPAAGEKLRPGRQTTGPQQPVPGGKRGRALEGHAVGEPASARKLPLVPMLFCAAGVAVFMVGLVIVCWPRREPPPTEKEPAPPAGAKAARP